MRQWSSREQARIRLAQLEREIAEILRAFPELRGRRRRVKISASGSGAKIDTPPGTGRLRRFPF